MSQRSNVDQECRTRTEVEAEAEAGVKVRLWIRNGIDIDAQKKFYQRHLHETDESCH